MLGAEAECLRLQLHGSTALHRPVPFKLQPGIVQARLGKGVQVDNRHVVVQGAVFPGGMDGRRFNDRARGMGGASAGIDVTLERPDCAFCLRNCHVLGTDPDAEGARVREVACCLHSQGCPVFLQILFQFGPCKQRVASFGSLFQRQTLDRHRNAKQRIALVLLAIPLHVGHMVQYVRPCETVQELTHLHQRRLS